MPERDTPTEPDPDAATTEGATATAAPMQGPPEEQFWIKYNQRLEFPLSTVATVLIHVMLGALLIVLLRLQGDEDKRSVPIQLREISGLDDIGEGSSGSGGEEDPIVKADNDPTRAAIASLPDPNKLPEVRNDLRQTIKYFDTTGNMPITDANAAAYAGLSESIQKKLIGAKQGSGDQKGSGFDGSKGKGPGGTGADSTLGRNMRWTLRFKVKSGRDYLDQLHAMNAQLMLPLPGSAECKLIPNIANPTDIRPPTDEDWGRLREYIKLSDSRPEVVNSVSRVLLLDFRPRSLWAFFPKNVEQELAEKEKSFRNRHPDDIEETVFSVSISGGSYVIKVEEQKVKR